MAQLLGTVRLILIFLVLIVGLVVVLVSLCVPGGYEGMRWPYWICTGMAKLFNLICNVRVHCSSPQKLRLHRGLIFVNHVSYLEPVILFSIVPGRFLAAIEVRRRPFIGWLAEAVDTVFVTREDRSSRSAVREEIAEAFQKKTRPPIVIFPEGRLGPGDRLNPFRFGSFEIAIKFKIPVVPCAIQYDRTDVAIWFGGAGETLLGAVWRLAKFPGPLNARVLPLETVYPERQVRAEELAKQVQHAMSVALDHNQMR